jgi:hypothetical protein
LHEALLDNGLQGPDADARSAFFDELPSERVGARFSKLDVTARQVAIPPLQTAAYQDLIADTGEAASEDLDVRRAFHVEHDTMRRTTRMRGR